MADPVVAGTWRVILTVQQANADFAQNVFHLKATGGTGVLVEADDIDSNVQGQWLASIKPNISSGDKLVKLRAQWLGSVPYPTFDYTHSDSGSVGTTALPKQVAAVISIHSDHPGRRGRGRMYIGSLTAANLNTDGSLKSTFIADCLTFGDFLASGFAAAASAVELGVYSRSDAAVYSNCTCSMDTRADVQRRRANVRTP